MKAPSFPSSQDAEAAFYEAFERADLDAMMAVWAEDEDIVCIHPSGPRLTGYNRIREGWRQIFSSGTRFRIHVTDTRYLRSMLLSVHTVQENILVAGEGGARSPVIATNVYLLTDKGWRMLVHHASPSPERAQDTDDPPPAVLH